MMIRQLGKTACRTYLLVSEKTREAVFIDPLLENAGDYLTLLRKEGLRLVYAIDTHTHADHLSAGAELQATTGAPYLMHEGTRASCVQRKVSDAETIGVGDLRLTFLHTPGHTGDSLCI